MFDTVGLMGWYQNEIDKILDLIYIGNEHIQAGEDSQRDQYYGPKFSKEDFEPIRI